MPDDAPQLFQAVDRRDDPHGRPRHEWRIEQGRRRRDQGTKQAEHGATAFHRRAGEQALAELAATGDTFTSDTLHERMTVTLPSNLVGALFRAAAARGEIEAVGYTQSTRPSRNAGVIRVWRGTDR